jgi:hypothetical protein
VTELRYHAIGSTTLHAGFGGVELDGATHEGLVKALSIIALDDRGWNSELGRELLQLAGHVLARVARRAGTEPADAVAFAWRLWDSADLSTIDNLWAYTSASVARDLAREREAREKLTSVKGLRRRGASDVRIIGIDGHDFAYVHELEEAEAIAESDSADRREARTSALTTFRQYLVMAGHPLIEADRTIEIISEALAESATTAAACDRLSRDHWMSANLGFDHGRWRALITLALGTTRGQPGLFALTARGHPNPLGIGYLRRARDRFLHTADELEPR